MSKKMLKYVYAQMMILVLVFMSQAAYAVELDDVYKNLGTYRVTTEKGLRVYFPETALEAMPGIIKRLLQGRITFRAPERRRGQNLHTSGQ